MELMSKRFRKGVINLMASRSNLLATVAKRGKGFLDQLKGRNDVELIEVTRKNRDLLPKIISQKILRELGWIYDNI